MYMLTIYNHRKKAFVKDYGGRLISHDIGSLCIVTLQTSIQPYIGQNLSEQCNTEMTAIPGRNFYYTLLDSALTPFGKNHVTVKNSSQNLSDQTRTAWPIRPPLVPFVQSDTSTAQLGCVHLYSVFTRRSIELAQWWAWTGSCSDLVMLYAKTDVCLRTSIIEVDGTQQSTVVGAVSSTQPCNLIRN